MSIGCSRFGSKVDAGYLAGGYVLRVFDRVQGAGRDCQDRTVVMPLAGGFLLILADGVGGMGGGSEAAEAILQFFVDRGLEFASIAGAERWALALAEADLVLEQDAEAGETTCVVAYISNGTVCGASVGNSRAWKIVDRNIDELTECQRRRPLLGSGEAVPIGFGPVDFFGRLLLGSDGLFDYGDREVILDVAMSDPIEEVSLKLVDAVRLTTGELMDDVGVIICENGAP